MKTPEINKKFTRREVLGLVLGGTLGSVLAAPKTAEKIATVLNQDEGFQPVSARIEESSVKETPSDVSKHSEDISSKPPEVVKEIPEITTPRWKPLATIPGKPGKLGFFLTSDDGTPLRPGDTLAFAKWLQERAIQAHFFINGRNDGGKIFQKPSEKEYEKLVTFIRELAALGHSVHNHSWNHTSMAKVSTREQLDDYLSGINELQGAIVEGAPSQREHYFRYAGGLAPQATSHDVQERIEGLFTKLNLRAIQWTHDTEDWRGNTNIAPTFTAAAKKGGTLLMHDRNWKHVQASIEKILKD